MGVVHVIRKESDLVELLGQHLEVFLDLVQLFFFWVHSDGYVSPWLGKVRHRKLGWQRPIDRSNTCSVLVFFGNPNRFGCM